MIAWAGALFLALASVPSLTGPVVDAAGALSQPERRRLEELAERTRAADGGNGPQLAFLLVPSLEGETIESYSIRVAERWKLGTKGKDNGLLFVVSIQDRGVRIEVGGGLEGELPDVQTSRIIRETIAPAFRQGAYGAGLRAGAERSLALLGLEGAGAGGEDRGPQLPPLVFLLVIFAVWLLARWLGIPIGIGGGGFGSGRGGGGRGGGGYRGGGGGFSGGGSSGRW